MKKVFKVLGIGAILLVGIIILRNLIIKSVVTTAVSRIVGAPVHIDWLSLNYLSSTIHISGFKMYNPSGFPEGILLSCPKIEVIYDRATLFQQQRHFIFMKIELKEMGITKNKEGKLNVDALKIVQEEKSARSSAVRIDLLDLNIGQVVYKDYRDGTEPSVRVYEFNKHKIYKSIPTLQQLIILSLVEPMKAATIEGAIIYGVGMLTGVATLPVSVVTTYIGKDYVRQVIDVSLKRAYEVSFEVVKRMGRITKEDVPKGTIKAKISGARVALQLKGQTDNKTEITISARKYLFPKPDIAGGVLYQILDKLQ